MVDAAPELSELLAASPGSKLVATSRAPLRLAGEHELPVPPLAGEPARELFVARARAVDPRLALSAEDAECVDRICERLDGLPLAIELAAARSKVLSPPAILDRLERQLDLLTAGPRDAPARQRTLRAAIGWSYDLLEEEARTLFAELGVFVGGWTLETAEAVTGPDALDGIAALVDQSLVTRDGDRFAMFESIRAFALEQLGAAGGLDDARRRHARAFAALTEEAEDGIKGPAQAEWFRRLDADAENLRAATSWALADGDTDTALRLAGGLFRFWAARGALTERRGLLATALAAGAGSPRPRVNALHAAGVMAAEAGDFDVAEGPLHRRPGARARRGRPRPGRPAPEQPGHARDVRRRPRAGGPPLRGERHDLAPARRPVRPQPGHPEPRHRRTTASATATAPSSCSRRASTLARRAGDPAHTASALRTLARVLLAGDDRPRPRDGAASARASPARSTSATARA